MFAGLHCLITGGSQGLGKSLAIELARLGAHVTIVARNPDTLKAAVKDIQYERANDKQTVSFVAADVTKYEEVEAAFLAAEKKSGIVPDVVFCCAGAAKPGFFLEQPSSDFEHGIRLNYLGALYTAKVAASLMVERGVRGRIIFVSSTVGLMGMVGYSQYSPAKFAIRGLAECLRQELLPHNIKMHVYFVSTIESPGFENENRTKPAITMQIEGADNSDKSPRTRALALLAGLRKDQFMITSDWATDLFRVAALGVNPCNFVLKDILLLLVGWLIIPIWRRYSDYLVARSDGKSKSA